LRGWPVQPLVTPQDLPNKKIGRCRQCEEHLHACLPRVALELWREYVANPGTVAGTAAIEADLELRISMLIREAADQEITHCFVDIEYCLDKLGSVTWWRRPTRKAGFRKVIQYGDHQPVPAAKRAQYGLHGSFGARCDLL